MYQLRVHGFEQAGTRERWVENKGAGLIAPANCNDKYLVATLTSLFHRATCGVPGLVTTERG